MTAPITAAFALAILLLVTLLAANTSRLRMRHRGSKDPAAAEEIRRASRTHGNNLEHGIVVILLLLFCELSGAGAPLLAGAGAAYLLARLVYSYGYLAAGGEPCSPARPSRTASKRCCSCVWASCCCGSD